MHTFFHGWRRKTGVVTLLMACVLMGLWARSGYFCDTLLIGYANRLHVIRLNQGSMQWVFWGAWSGVSSNKLMWKYNHSQNSTARVFLGEWQFNNGVWSIPAYAFVVPLTLLSAYLILWKPWKQA